jgi:uncharacterized protein
MNIRNHTPNFHAILDNMIDRQSYRSRLASAVRRSRVTALIGPRQSGKTTLARDLAGRRTSTYFNLDQPGDQARLANPGLALAHLRGLVVLDEIQAMPELFTTLRALADRQRSPAKFLVLGSASPVLMRRASESLAGRVEFIELEGFSLAETGATTMDALWVRGGFPRSFLAKSDTDSLAWREGFIRTFLERDIPELGISIPTAAMRRFWTMLAHYHGQTWNSSELARSMGLSDKTVRGHLDVLTGAFMIRQLQPWHENLGKRQVKAPKIYFRDSGLLHSLLAIPDRSTLLGHPRAGASWEGFALSQVLQWLTPAEAYFWATHNGAELDLFIPHRGRRYGFEFKFNEAPTPTRSMRIALDDLRLDHLWIVHPGTHTYRLDERITAWPLRSQRRFALSAR